MKNELKEFRLSHELMAQEMVDVLQGIYPKYDKTVQSKCENTEKYGVMLAPEGIKLLYETFAPDEPIPTKTGSKSRTPRRDSGNKLKCRISARLPDERLAQLQQHIKADGYSTMQEWISNQVENYLAQSEKEQSDE